MRICEFVQVDTETVTNTVLVDDYDADGNLVGQHEETVTREVPVMGTVYRDATPEEEASAAAEAAEMAEWERTRPRTAEERFDAYVEETDAALIDLDTSQVTYESETDAALFDLAEYVASLEARIQALEA